MMNRESRGLIDLNVLWNVDPLLGNCRERSSYQTAFAKQRLRKQATIAQQ
jgi:hypothetical protein